MNPARIAFFLLAALLLTAWRLASVQHQGFTLFYDEAQYWDWSRTPDWGYFSKPPLIAWLVAASTALFGHGEPGVKALTLLLYPLTAGIVGLLAHAMKPRAGLPAALLFLCTPLAGVLGLFATTDAPLLFAWALAAWALWQAQRRNRLQWWLLLGVATGIGLLAKYTMAAFVLTALPALWLLPGPRHGLARPGPWLALAVAALMLAPNIAWNAAHHFPTLQHTADITTASDRRGGLGEAAAFLVGQALLIGPLAAFWAVAGWAGGWVGRNQQAPSADRAARRYALLLSLPLLGVATLQAWHAHAHLNWAAPAAVGACVAAAMALGTRQHTRHAPSVTARSALGGVLPRALLVALLLNLLLIGLTVHGAALWRAATGAPLPSRLDVFARMRGWDQAFADLRRQIGQNDPALLQALGAEGLASSPGPAQDAAVNPQRAIVLARERLVLTQTAYQWRDLNLRPVSWNPEGRLHDHYDMTTHFAPAPGQPVLLLSQRAEPTDMLERFADVRHLADVRLESAPGRWIELHAWRVGGFKGTGQR